MIFRVRELLIRQRTQMTNALRVHLAEFGAVVPQGAVNAARFIALVEYAESGLPDDARGTLEVPVGTLAQLDAQIGMLDVEVARRAKENEVARRLMTFPGIGPLIATAIAVSAPLPETFKRSRFCRVARLGAAPAFDGRQAALGRHHQDGAAILAAPADHRRQQRRHQATRPQGGAAGHLAGRPAA